MKPVLLLSNGHGEDLSGALLAKALLDRGQPVEALPLVGHGQAYYQAGITVLGQTREYSTGGLGYTSLAGRLQELTQGQVGYLLRRLTLVLRHRRRWQLVVVVGDLVPVLAAWLARQPAVVYLVAYSSHYEGRLRLPWPCGWLLRRPLFQARWSRDALTATDLSQQQGCDWAFHGNPFLDLVMASPEPLPRPGRQALALLPGSRLPEALANLELMLRLLPLLPEPLHDPQRLMLRAALVRNLNADLVAGLATRLGWSLDNAGQGEGSMVRWRRGTLLLELHWGRFAAVLADADLVLSMTGTAAEQAVGLGKPVLQIPGAGPQFTPGFAEAQRRLLGPGVVCAPGGSSNQRSLATSAALAARLLERQADPIAGPAWRRELAALGAQRIGTAGGSDRLAAAIMELLPTPPQARDA